MLISFANRYIFLANRKAASTTIEDAFGRECEIAIGIAASRFARHTRTGGATRPARGGGKHTSYRDLETTYAMMFDRIAPIEAFLVFGIMREPLSRLRSYYQFQGKKAGARERVSSFEEFLRDAMRERERPTVESQHDFFRDGQGAIRMNYLVRLEDMARSLETLRDETGLDFARAAGIARNASPERPRAPIEEGLKREVERYYARDYELYEGSTDRLLDPRAEAEIDPEAALQWMYDRFYRFEVASSIAHKLRERIVRDPGFSLAGLVRAIDAD